MSGDVRFVRSYPLASFGHVENYERTLQDKDVRWINVSNAVSGSHASGILYISCMYLSMSVLPELWNGQL